MLVKSGDADGSYLMNKICDKYSEYLKIHSDLEERYTEEDTENAMKVVEIRSHLWT